MCFPHPGAIRKAHRNRAPSNTAISDASSVIVEILKVYEVLAAMIGVMTQKRIRDVARRSSYLTQTHQTAFQGKNIA